MSVPVAAEDFKVILRVIERYPSGLSIEQINAVLPKKIPVRTLQRRLAQLVYDGWMMQVGQGCAARYRLAPGRVIPRATPVASAPAAPPLVTSAPSVPTSAPDRRTGNSPFHGPSVPPEFRSTISPPLSAVGSAKADPPSAPPITRPSAPRSLSPSVQPSLVTPAAPAPPLPDPITARERAKYDDLLRRLIPPMINAALNRQRAMSYADSAAENLPTKEAPRFLEIVELELDSLDDEALTYYALDPAAFARWRKNWQ